jgi:threonine/homoserine/homoserine lactone efflux protein
MDSKNIIIIILVLNLVVLSLFAITEIQGGGVAILLFLIWAIFIICYVVSKNRERKLLRPSLDNYWKWVDEKNKKEP